MLDSIATWWMWAGFAVIVIAMLAIDLFAMGGKKAYRPSLKQAAAWSINWVVVAMAFNLALWFWLDGQMGQEIANQKSIEFLTGYIIEKSLAIDNVFVWLMLFGYFAVPVEYQRRVLLYGVIGAIVMRTVMIFAGAWLIAQFHWILYIFGALLIFTGLKMLYTAGHTPDLEQNPLLRWLRKRLKVTPSFHQERFFVVKDGVRYATPLFLVLVLVEISDLIFAVDSIPAIFAITTDPFIVLTSNIFAILGLRAMYFLIRSVADRFHLLKYGLAAILVFVGCKILLQGIYKIPVFTALAVVLIILALSMMASYLFPAKQKP